MLTASNNPWLQPAGLSEIKISCEALKQIAENQLDTFHDTIRKIADTVMSIKPELQQRTACILLLHLLRKRQLNRHREIVFFEKGIPFYLDCEPYSQQDVKNMLQELEGKQLYRLPEAPSEQEPQGSSRP